MREWAHTSLPCNSSSRPGVDPTPTDAVAGDAEQEIHQLHATIDGLREALARKPEPAVAQMDNPKMQELLQLQAQCVSLQTQLAEKVRSLEGLEVSSSNTLRKISPHSQSQLAWNNQE